MSLFMLTIIFKYKDISCGVVENNNWEVIEIAASTVLATQV